MRARNPDDLLTPAEVAAELRKTDRQLRRWREKGLGPEFVRFETGLVYYRWRAVQAYIAKHTVLPKAPPPPRRA